MCFFLQIQSVSKRKQVKMGNIRVENCCCFSLETGVLILGVFDLIAGILTAGQGVRIVGDNSYAGSDLIVEGRKFSFYIKI